MRDCLKHGVWVLIAMLTLAQQPSQAQTASRPTVTLQLKGVPLSQALKKVQNLSGYKILFVVDDVNGYTVNENIVKASAQQAVAQLLEGKPFSYSVNGNFISISRKATPKAAPQTDNSESKEQLKRITGTITDEQGEPLIGAAVNVPGSPYGTITDVDGRFELLIPENCHEVQVSYVGMKTTNMPVGKKENITFAMGEDRALLDEVIVTGYQTLSKERATGAFAKVTTKELESKRMNNLTSVLEGEVAGYNNGSIRGLSTMYGETSPLYVIDGFPIENQTMDEQGKVTTNLPDLNMDDIQDITVLKDAAAASIYGARAANGVIVITTKKGSQNDKLEVGFNISLAWKPYGLYTGNLASSADMINLEKEWAASNTSLQVAGAQAYAQKALAENYYPNAGINAILNYYAGNTSEAQMNSTLSALAAKGYNYYDQVAKYAKRDQFEQQYNLNLAKTTGKNMFKASVTYKHNAYEDKYSKDQSVGINLNNVTKLTKWMTFEVGSYMQFGDEDVQTYDPLSPGYTVLPYDDLVNADGSYYTRPGSLLYNSTKQQALADYDMYSEDITPMANLDKGVANTKSISLRAYARLNIDITSWLKYSGSFQYERGSNKFRQIQEAGSLETNALINSFATVDNGSLTYNLPYGNVLYTRDQYRKSYNFRQQLSFDYTISDLHNITAILGTETRENKLEMHRDTYYNYNDQTLTSGAINEAMLIDGVTNAFSNYTTLSQPAQFYETKNRYVSIYGNAAYTYDTRYTVSASMRWDRSNLWGTSNQYQNKPIWSVGLSWNASNEKFIKDIQWINMLKVRATYGITGNVNPTYSPYLVTYSGTNYNIGEPYQYVSSRPNSDLSWEKTKVTNIGVDFSLLKNRLRGTIDYYYKYGERLLATSQGVPTEGYGYSSYAINNGEMSNRGLELTLAGDIVRTGDLTWTLNGMLSLNKNKVEYVNVKAPVYFLALDYSTAYPTIGDQYGAIYGYEWAGLSDEGMPQVYDENGEITTTAPTSLDAIKCIGNARPTYSGSFGTTLSWHNFDFSMLFTYEGNYKMRNTNMPFLNYAYVSGIGYVSKIAGQSSDIANRWMQAGDEATTSVPRAAFTEAGLPLTSMYSTYYYSSANLLDASHVKLSNVSLAYHLPSALIRKAYLTNARVQLNVENPCLWAKSKQAKYQLGGYNATTYVLGLYLNF
ncbi:MAG: SusC/RagA family TonB-linked outer membrane protein [Prevotella sp.]|nr:SusC/RagA family TonB-linked outer membrane protein [Prevotella sp.]